MSAVQGTVNISGRTVAYEAVADCSVLRDDTGQELASMFSVSYRRTDVASDRRPVIYAFDGGPGTASVTLHLSLLGPRRAVLDTDDQIQHLSRIVPPLADNDRSLLDIADIVVVDAVGTGFSRAGATQDPRRFCGYTEDVRITAQFITEHLHRTGRSASPVILLGESYGGARAAGLAFELEDKWDLYPAGVVLLVPAVSSQALSFVPGNDLPYVVYLPTMAAVARFHGRAGGHLDLDKWLDEVERFAVDDYAPALLRGGALEPAERRRVAAQLAVYTGLSEDFVDRCNLRISDQRFFKELLRSDRRTLSRANPRVAGIDRDAAGDETEHDPHTAWIRRVFGPLANHYLRTELGYQTDRRYLVYNSRVLPWKYADVAENRFHFPVESLRLAVAKHPAMRVFVGTGCYDGSVPYFAVDHAIDHAFIEPALRANLTRRRYEASHILYYEETPAQQLRDDLASYLAGVVGDGVA